MVKDMEHFEQIRAAVTEAGLDALLLSLPMGAWLALLMICCPTLYRFFLFIFDRQMRNRSLKKLK